MPMPRSSARGRHSLSILQLQKQGCGSAFISSGSGSGSSILGWIPIRIQGFNDRKLKILQLKKNLIFFWSKTTIYLSLGLNKERSSYRRSLFFQDLKEAIQHFKTWTFNFFLLLWVIFALPDPDPDSESGSGSTDPIESGSNPDTDPDPQPCTKDTNLLHYSFQRNRREKSLNFAIIGIQYR